MISVGSEVQILPGPPVALIQLLGLRPAAPAQAGPWFWGCSSAGRAPALQAGGRRFDPDHLHQPFSGFGVERIGGAICRWRHGEEKEIGLAVWVRKNRAAGAVGVPHAWDDAVVFVRVNQVLVRLWARETAMGRAQAWSGGSSVDRSYRLTGCCGILRSRGEGSEALERSVGTVGRRGRWIVCCVLSKSVRRRRMAGTGASLDLRSGQAVGSFG